MFHIRIFKHYLPLQYIILALLEYWLLVLAVYLAVTIRLPQEVINILDHQDPYAYRSSVFAIVMLCCTLSLGVYESKLREGFSGLAVRSVVSFFLLGSAALTVLYYIFPMLQLGRGVLSIAVVLSLILCLLARALFFLLVDISRLKRNVLVLGAGARAEEIRINLESGDRNSGCQIIGFVPNGSAEQVIDQERLLDLGSDLLEFCKSNRVNEIVVALDERRRNMGGNLPIDSLLDCKLAGIEVIDAVGFCEREIGRIELNQLDPSWMLFSEGFRYSGARDLSKRIFDIVISLILVAVAWPFMLLTALAVYLEDGAPVLYRQTRVGLNGKHFDLFKFRSMRTDAEKNGAVWARQKDDRVTRVGAFIRNTRLDELPQIYNVLSGDMSFVGPRPERPEFVGNLSKQIPFYDERHRVKPGLMGWAQLKYPYGASVEDAAQKLRYDLYYTKNHSLLLDILIVIQTVEVVLLGKGVR